MTLGQQIPGLGAHRLRTGTVSAGQNLPNQRPTRRPLLNHGVSLTGKCCRSVPSFRKNCGAIVCSCIPCVPDFILPASREPGNFIGIIKSRTQCLRWSSNREAETCPFCKSISAAENSPIILMAASDVYRKAQPQG